MSVSPRLPEEILRHIFYFATLIAPVLPLLSDPSETNPFEHTSSQTQARALGLSTRRNLNAISRLFHSLVEEHVLEDIILASVESVNSFADFISHEHLGRWVHTLKISFATQWTGSTVRPAHAIGITRILAACTRLVVYEDALESGAGSVATDVLSALTARESLRAVGWTGEAYPSTTDVRTLVEALPNLDTLYLRGCNPGTRTDRSLPPPPTPVPAMIPCLKSLTLRLAEIRGADTFPLFITANIPALTYLTLIGTFHFGGNVAANTAALRQFFEIHGPQLESLDIRDDERFAPAGPLVEFLEKCTQLREVVYPVSWTPPLCAMDKVETVGLRTVAPDLLVASFETGQAGRVALEYLDAHLDVLVGGSFPKLKTIRFLDDEMVGGYSPPQSMSPLAENYLTTFSQRCSKLGIKTVDSRGALISF
ncbi:hypothetical protein RSOL_510910 [Rhizoctonia solani AG-3 Rhs1AP]|uniref:F-box-like domain protein n=1 Tax=Rhizoctonia solani AG-3 Rhs1AP TaxID=1086054 RepID=X8JUN0_9AGAM|nr:hypothetical protein RSOL_510910 [Rhizoctonia solani AG-3 Rhs1AP]